MIRLLFFTPDGTSTTSDQLSLDLLVSGTKQHSFTVLESSLEEIEYSKTTESVEA